MKKTAAVIAAILAVLVLCGQAAAEPLKAGKNLRREPILLPDSTPDKERLLRVDWLIVADEEGDVGILILYDDARSSIKVDYIEFYDLTGDLLAISWIDGLGICQVAVEVGLLDEEDPGIEGVLVTMTGGDPL
ncbi:MAG TPA: hypothetical protein VNN77_13675 [candidate division Zixibacteria bacterium]|nr:hypothetical protein [candidate division Zixibacteria bacterium]